jgi:CheY-like chemotaxis protein
MSATGRQKRPATKSDTRDRLTATGAQFETDRDLPKLLNAVLTAAITVTEADFGNVQLVQTQDGALRIVAQQGFSSEFLNFFRYVKMDKSACSAALRERSRVIVRDVTRSRVYTEPARRAMLSANARACQSTPVVGLDGRVLGIISTHFRVPHRPTRQQLALIDTLARTVAGLIGNGTPPQAPMDVDQIIERSRDDASGGNLSHLLTKNALHRRHGTVRVLIADADDDTRSRFGESLKRAGCDVVDAVDGRDALVKALSQRPALVITETR